METTNTNNAVTIFDSHRKEAIKKLKEKIAKAVEEQKIFKENRKTVNFKGERKYEPWEAAMRADNLSRDLRIMYAAYGILKGRNLIEIENYIPKSWKNTYHPLMEYCIEINLLLKEYGYQSKKWSRFDQRYKIKTISDYYDEIVRID